MEGRTPCVVDVELPEHRSDVGVSPGLALWKGGGEEPGRDGHHDGDDDRGAGYDEQPHERRERRHVAKVLDQV